MFVYQGTFNEATAVTSLGDALVVTALFQPLDEQQPLQEWYATVSNDQLQGLRSTAEELHMECTIDSLLFLAADEINWLPCEQGA